MEHKTFSAYTLKTDTKQGIVEAIVAVMGNIDQGDDIIHPGSFTKTIQERRGKIRVLDQHQTDSIMRVVGVPLDIRELGRDQLPAGLLQQYPDATGGLYTKTQYLLNTPEGLGTFQRIDAGAVDEYSIGYDPLDVDYSKVKMPNGTERTARNLRTNKLYEYSPVIWAMNSATQTLSAKGATGSSDLPLADRAKAWDSNGAEGRVRSWAGATDGPNAKYRSAFFWYDAAKSEDFTAYKLQFADVIDGKLTAIPRGIFAVAAVLQGSRGGTNIPQGDQDAIKSKVNGYYGRMRKEFDDETIVAPWEAKAYKDMKPWNVFHEGDKWNVYKLDADGKPTGDALGSFDNEAEARSQVRALYANENGKSAKSTDLTSYVQEVTEAFNEQFGMGDPMMPMSECFCIWRVFDDHVIVCEMMSDDYYSVDYSMIDGDVVFAPKPLWVEGDLMFAPEMEQGSGEMKRYTPPLYSPTATKAGRVLAARNADRIMSAARSLMAALADAGIDMGASDNTDTTDMTDNAPAKRAAGHDATAQAGPTNNTSPTDETLRASIEIELAQLQLLGV
jgi:HK97 family phage prohead protease